MIWINKIPTGAITKVEVLQHLVAQAQAGKKVSIFDVNGVGPAVNERILTEKCGLEPHEQNFILKADISSPWYESIFHLADYNIGAHCNNNFVFLSRKAAQRYCDFARSDPGMVEARKAWREECDSWDQMFDDDYWEPRDDD